MRSNRVTVMRSNRVTVMRSNRVTVMRPEPCHCDEIEAGRVNYSLFCCSRHEAHRIGVSFFCAPGIGSPGISQVVVYHPGTDKPIPTK